MQKERSAIHQSDALSIPSYSVTISAYGVTERARIIENQSSYRWLQFDPAKGAPFSMYIPLLEDDIIPALQDKSTITPFSRWTVGRKSNPNFASAGSGIEGHLCAFAPNEILGILDGLQNDAFHILKADVGIAKLTTFLEDQSKPIGLKLLTSGRIAFEIALAKARAMRAMVEKGGYYYSNDNVMKTVDHSRRERCTRYQTFVYSTPPLIDWAIEPVERGTLRFSQELVQKVPQSPIAVEYIGNDIGTNQKYKLLAELGRFGHPTVPVIRNCFE